MIQYNLSGVWEVALAPYEQGEVVTHAITLPGTLDEAKLGIRNDEHSISKLSRYYTYEGGATYKRQIEVPSDWEGRIVTLVIERSRQTRVWVNGQPAMAINPITLATPQHYDLTQLLHYGKENVLTIEVDNRYQSMPREAIVASSMATEETQTNWNGILGEMMLCVEPVIRVEQVRVLPLESLENVDIEVVLVNNGGQRYDGELHIQAAKGLVHRKSVGVSAYSHETYTIRSYHLGAHIRLWDEWHPHLYNLQVKLGELSQKNGSFGVRVMGVDKGTGQLTNNKKKLFLRNETNCAVFPLTGYAPMDEISWEKLFKQYKAYGMNSVRFHSWCPPEAAFKVADRLGLYLMPELSCWKPKDLYKDPLERSYYKEEGMEILKAYGHHPSFIGLSLGNEPIFSENGYAYADELLQLFKAYDGSRLYTFGSNSYYGNYLPTEHSEWYTSQSYKGLLVRGTCSGMSGFVNQSYPSSQKNYGEAVEKCKEDGRPIISFEVGQFQIFPDLMSEIHRYKGVLEPRNLKWVQEKVEALGWTTEYINRCIEASGELSRLAYRMEIEAALRTPYMSGISLLGIQDFSGQGTALVGMMNALGEAKPYEFAKPNAFRAFFNECVPLLVTERFVWTSEETFTGKMLLAHYGPEDKEESGWYRLLDQKGKCYVEKTLEQQYFVQGEVSVVGQVQIPLKEIPVPSWLTLEIGVGERCNRYDLWVYPKKGLQQIETDIYIADYIDEEVLRRIVEGGKVFLSPKVNKLTLPHSITGTFTTAFWSSIFVSEAQPGTLGLLMDEMHPVFKQFPTAFHSHYQWWPMSKLGRAISIEGVNPLIQVIDGFLNLRTLGLLYEMKVGQCQLMLSTMGLEQLQEAYKEAYQLRQSILNYMETAQFHPVQEVTLDVLGKQVVHVTYSPRENVAEKSKGGMIYLGEGTLTSQDDYDLAPQDRLMELNDGRVDVENFSRSWTNWRKEGGRYDQPVIFTVVFDKAYKVDSVALPFYENDAIKAPAHIEIAYWEEGQFKEVSFPSKMVGFEGGKEEISFAPVKTTQIQIKMTPVYDKAIALSELIVYKMQEHEG